MSFCMRFLTLRLCRGVGCIAILYSVFVVCAYVRQPLEQGKNFHGVDHLHHQMFVTCDRHSIIYVPLRYATNIILSQKQNMNYEMYAFWSLLQTIRSLLNCLQFRLLEKIIRLVISSKRKWNLVSLEFHFML